MNGPPKLPTDISPNGEEIWAWGRQLSEWSQQQAKIRQLRIDVARVDCGGCNLWMTRQCPRERNVNGRNHGPSMYSPICPKYAEKSSTAKLRDERKAELAALLEPSNV